MQLKKIKNGIIIKYLDGTEEFHLDVDSLFNKLLQEYEGRADVFGGDSYGIVKVFRKPGEKFISPGEIEPA